VREEEERMKIKIIVILFAVVVVGVPVGVYFLYNSYLRFQDDYTSCPVKAFRSAVTAPSAAGAFATQASYGSLENTEKCSLDCENGNTLACAVYGLALQEGIFLMKHETAAKTHFKRACDEGEPIGCGLATRMDELAAQKAAAEAEAALKKANAEKLVLVEKAKQGAALRQQQALKFFRNKMGVMQTPKMVAWYKDTVRFLLYEKPLLSQMHQIQGSGAMAKDLELEEFVTAKYVQGPQGLMLDEMLAFFNELRRLGVLQIRLDHYVEKKKESEIPKKHNYFRAKHTFLYRVGKVEHDILSHIEKILQ
jgi:hypothetical protein